MTVFFTLRRAKSSSRRGASCERPHVGRDRFPLWMAVEHTLQRCPSFASAFMHLRRLVLAHAGAAAAGPADQTLLMPWHLSFDTLITHPSPTHRPPLCLQSRKKVIQQKYPFIQPQMNSRHLGPPWPSPFPIHGIAAPNRSSNPKTH